MKPVSILRTLFVLASFTLASAGAMAKSVAYPTVDDAKFTVEVPDSWEMEPAEEEGGFVNLTGPSGILVSLRTVDTSEFSMDDVITETNEFLKENYTEVKMDKLERDKTSALQVGSGKNEDTDVVFSNAWHDIRGKYIAEIRLVVDVGDDAGLAEAGKMLKTFAVP